MAFDHGILNVPLAKRGNIDARIDAYKRDQAKAAKAKARAVAADVKALAVTAKALVDNLPAERLAVLANKSGLTVTQAHKKLRSMAHWSPAFVIRSLEA